MVTDKLGYSEKLANLVEDSSNNKVKKDPILRTERNMSQILNNDKDYFTLTKD